MICYLSLEILLQLQGSSITGSMMRKGLLNLLARS